VIGVEGVFGAGDSVALADDTGCVFAQGIACYGAADLRRIAGRTTAELAAALGLSPGAAPPHNEAVHRDQLALLLPSDTPASPGCETTVSKGECEIDPTRHATGSPAL
jgi:glutamate 5-kinase